MSLPGFRAVHIQPTVRYSKRDSYGTNNRNAIRDCSTFNDLLSLDGNAQNKPLCIVHADGRHYSYADFRVNAISSPVLSQHGDYGIRVRRRLFHIFARHWHKSIATRKSGSLRRSFHHKLFLLCPTRFNRRIHSRPYWPDKYHHAIRLLFNGCSSFGRLFTNEIQRNPHYLTTPQTERDKNVPFHPSHKKIYARFGIFLPLLQTGVLTIFVN